MNHYQQLAKKRLNRRFSSGDGVRLTAGEAKGQSGHIVAIGAYARGNPNVAQYTIVLTSKEGVVSANEDSFESCPAANIGKYGGPSRGGAPERGAVSSHYRHHGRRR